MARSFSNAKTVSSFIANQITTAVSRRGYSAASQGVVSNSKGGRVGAPNVMLKRGSEETSWVPDPVTGYYRPESQAQVKELDPVELRKMLIRSKVRAK